ncbi:MAG TPA: hypothetical protein VE783_11165 [Candidatus Limnocylindrales bacterium]|jgi:hypothetical protein|nr:hypothetical protein [Candidatus Limnocylindrales bacterium]
MSKRILLPATALFLFCAAAGSTQYPVLDAIADRVIAKYQNSSCEQLWEKKMSKPPMSQQEQEMIQFLKNSPQARAAFINRIAGPIANKMFDCDMIP